MHVPRPIPTGDGPNPSKSTMLCRYRGRRRRVRARQHRAGQEPVATNAGCQRGRSCIQLQERRHQDQRDRILRVCVYGKDGIKPDPSKIEDIRKMPTPQDREDLQWFIGLMNYLAEYIPHFADKVSPLRELIKKDVPFVWHEDHQRTYDDLKRCIGSESCLSYYHPQKETVLEVDASQKGLGACLLQDNKPVVFASKTLTPTQSAYSNIERETLAIVNGVTKFHTYRFGKPFVIITDHKHLLMIHSKPLKSAPPRLQRLLVKIQGYDFQLVYRPGNQMIKKSTTRMPVAST